MVIDIPQFEAPKEKKYYYHNIIQKQHNINNDLVTQLLIPVHIWIHKLILFL
jgi:hypothetical protein